MNTYAGTTPNERTSEAAELRVRVAPALGDIDPAAWDACAWHAPASADVREDAANPFVSHAFLSALEASGSVGGRSGWQSAHLVVEDGSTLVAAAPCYAKSHSQGEYVFDHSWADAYERAGGRYYPKLQVAVPFTPATGRRLLVRPGLHAARAEATLIAGLQALRSQANASSLHCTFVTEREWERLGQAGFLQRTDQQFHWLNEGYRSFDDFLAQLSSRKRKTIKRERRDALANDISIEWLTGASLTEAHWDAFFAFYMDTGGRKWGRPYLTRAFFSEVGRRLPERTLLVMAKREGRYIAGAINFIGADTLYGRNWGCIEEHPFLHFEVCYYQAMDFAISRGLDRVEAGAQGEHKLARGYRPTITRSAHDIADPGLRRAIADYLRRERQYVDAAQDQLDEHLPFRKDERHEVE